MFAPKNIEPAFFIFDKIEKGSFIFISKCSGANSLLIKIASSIFFVIIIFPLFFIDSSAISFLLKFFNCLYNSSFTLLTIFSLVVIKTLEANLSCSA